MSMQMKQYEVVRASGKDIKYLALALLLFLLMGAIGWGADDFRYVLYYIVFIVVPLLYAMLHMILRYYQWKIILSQDSVFLYGTFGRVKQYPRGTVRWILIIPWGSRTYHIQLYEYSTRKKLVSVPLDWINVKVLFDLPHFGPMSSDERSACSYFKKMI
ncbi:MAG: hypothetical protein KBS46_02645 [Clostridiales bacterium]|nr:hypothetical protein [Candidatus Apopatocola equi]